MTTRVDVASVEPLTGLPGQAFGSIKLSTLRELAFVPTVVAEDEDSPAPDKHGYQREPNKRRFTGIGKDYLAGDMVTPLLISVRVPETDRADFEALFRAGDVETIHAMYSPRVFAIVDGQHRLGGLMWAQDQNPDFDPSVPVTLIYGLTYEAEARLFDITNTEQKAIPRTLVEYTKATITETRRDTYEQKIRGITMDLIIQPDSVWANRVNFTGGSNKGGRKTTFEGLRRSTATMFPREFLARVEAAEMDPTELAKMVWTAVAATASTAWNSEPTTGPDGEQVAVAYRLNDLVGIATVAMLGKDILAVALDRYEQGTPIEETVAHLIARLHEVDWRKGQDNDVMAGRAGWAGVKAMYEALYPVVFQMAPQSPLAAAALEEAIEAQTTRRNRSERGQARPEGDTPPAGD